MEERVLTVKLYSIPPEELHFQILKADESSAGGAQVSLCSKGVIPVLKTKTADANGKVIFKASELVPPIGIPLFDKTPWLFMAYMENSELGVWRDEAKFSLQTLYTYKLKKYTAAPTFFIKIQLRDVIGAELFGNFVADVQAAALEKAGLEVTKVTGKGTKFITINFKPPWHESPIVIDWVVVWFVVKIMSVAAAIIAILVVLKWTFGKAAAPVIGGLGFGVLVILALMLAPKAVKEVRRKEKR